MTSLPLKPMTDKGREGVCLAVRLSPKASRNAILGVGTAADGAHYVKATVTAVPENGKANAALIKLLAKALHMPKSAFVIMRGETDRQKQILILGAPADLMPRLAQWLGERE